MLPVLLVVSSALAWQVKTDGEGNELHWTTPDVPFAVHPDVPEELDPLEAEQAIIRAAERWSEVPDVDVILDFAGETDTARVDYADGENVVFFDPDWELGESLLAVTYVWSVDGGEIIAFDMVVNARDYEWTTRGDEEANDLMNSIVHEFGHALGLDHSALDEATMYGTTHPGETRKRDLYWDDEDGLRHLYAAALLSDDAPAGCAAPGASPRGGLLALLAGLAGTLIRRRDRSVVPGRGRDATGTGSTRLGGLGAARRPCATTHRTTCSSPNSHQSGATWRDAPRARAVPFLPPDPARSAP